MGKRQVPFSRILYIERDDFREDPPKKYFRLSPGAEVRLRYGYYITCRTVEKDVNTGEIIALHCTYDPDTRGGWSKDGRKVKGTIHWVSAPHALDAEVRLYDRLFSIPNPADKKEGPDFKAFLNDRSLEVIKNCKVEPILKHAPPGSRYQFERQGYFCRDTRDSTPESPVFNRTVTLRDTWEKIEKKQIQNE
jgi:glutaminyl-tRNA synthetase